MLQAFQLKPFGTVQQSTSPENYPDRLPCFFDKLAALLVLPASKWLSVRGTWSDEQRSQVRAEMGGIGWASCGKVSRTFPGQSARSLAPVEVAEHKISWSSHESMVLSNLRALPWANHFDSRGEN